MSRSMRGKGMEKRFYSSSRGRTSEEFSTSVESSASWERRLLPAGETFSWRNKPSRSSSAGNCKRRGFGDSTFEIGSHDDKREDCQDDDPIIQPDMEAYCRGSWWDAKVLARDGDNYLIHYETFSDDDDEWVPLGHLRLRSRLAKVEDCQNVLEPGIDVCVMADHPQAFSLPAWYDAQIVDIERRHTVRRCHCIFLVQLYTIPKVLPRDYQRRTLLTGPPCRAQLAKMSVMRGANNMPFQQVVTAALPNLKDNVKRKWAKDVTLWYSSFLVSANTFKERSFSFESRVAGGTIIPPEPVILRPFEAFLEEEGLKKKEPDTWSPLGEPEDDLVPLSALLTPRKVQVPSGSKSGKKPKDGLASVRVPSSPALTPRDESKSHSAVFGSKTRVSEDGVVPLAVHRSPGLTPRDGLKSQNAISGSETRRISEDDAIPFSVHSFAVPISQEELKSQSAFSGLKTRRKPDDTVPLLVPSSPVLTSCDRLKSWSGFSGLESQRKPGDDVMPTPMYQFPGFTAEDGLTCQFAIPGSVTKRKPENDVVPLSVHSSPALTPQNKLNCEFAISGSESKNKPVDDVVAVSVQSSPLLTPEGGTKSQSAFSGSETKRKLEDDLTLMSVHQSPGLTPQDVLNSPSADPSSRSGGKPQDDKVLLPVCSSPLLPKQADSKVKVVVSGSKNRPIVLDVDDDKDVGEYCSKGITSTSGFTCLDRFSSEDRPTSPESLEDNVGEAPDVATSSESLEDSGNLLHDLIMSERSPSKVNVHHHNLGKPSKVAPKSTVLVTSSESSDPDDFAKYLEQEISSGPVKRYRPKFAKTVKQTPKFPLSWPPRVTKLKDGNCKKKNSWKKVRTVTPEIEVPGLLAPPKPHKQKAGEEIKSFEMMGLEDFADGLEDILVAESPVVSELVARSKEKHKAGLASQVIRPKRKRQRNEGIIVVLKTIKKEVTYADLFKAEEKEPERPQMATNDKSADRGGCLLPSWNPLMEHWGPEPKQEVKEDPVVSDVWEDMRVAMERSKASSEVDQEKEKEKAEKLAEVNKCYNQDGTKSDKEHIFDFRPEAGLVCQVCGLVGLEIENMWERDHPKRLHNPKEPSDDDYESDHAGMGFSWDLEYERPTQHDSLKGGSIFDQIPHLERHMQKHQKEGFEFLWRNLAGLDSRRQPFWPPREPGGCVLSHAPGTGKSFLVISFLQSYMKVNQNCRPLIVAPKIMLQPWEKEFRKWNVDIPVFIFNQAEEVVGRQLFQQHEEAGDIQLKTGAKLSVRRDVYRQAMLWQWHKQPSVLVISYGLLTALIDKEPPSEERKVIREQLLKRSNILILDEGHFARNKNAKVRKALMLAQTQLRILLSGTLFQNNFEELFTTLNLVRSGFVNAFAKSGDLSTEIQDMEARGDVKDTANIALLDGVAKVAETRARKLFIEEIGNKIDRGQRTQGYSESLARGLERLQKLTSPFVHHYTGDILRSLPPLRDFAIMLQPTVLQEKMLQKLVERMVSKTMLEQEIIMSLVCIHPALFSESRIGQLLSDLLSPQEMKQVTTNRDPSAGVKTRFVINLLKLLQNSVLGGHEKMLVFSQNLDPLLLLEEMMNTAFGWAKERDFLQLDGSHNLSERQSIIEQFNDPTGGVRVLLASTKACGEGITLTGASRVVFMDVLWNPAVIRQAISRAFRLGQTKIVYVYRLVASGSFEERKYRKMVYKDWMSRAIFNSSVEGAEHGDKSSIEGRGPPKHRFWEITGDSSKDTMLKELLRQDSTSGLHAFKRMFRHEGFFDDDYDKEPGGKGMDATDWLHGEEGSVDLSDGETDNDSCERDINDCDNLDDE